MDLDIMREMKFGSETVWTCKTTCGWCQKKLINHSLQSYTDRGNCCSECNTLYAKIAMQENKESEISHRDRLIKQTRLESDLIALELDKPISEERRLEIVGLLEQKFVKIKMLKGE